MHITFLFPEGKSRAVTLSYDDGPLFDFHLLNIINEYGLKATFHLNSCLLRDEEPPATRNEDDGGHVNIRELADIYAGHEIACHGATHPFLERLAPGEAMREVWNDRLDLERGAKYPIIGMSYPYGTYNDCVINILRAAGIRYCRTVDATKRFSLPNDFLVWNPTCHHHDALELAPRFLRPNMNDYSVFYIWGHAHEFAHENNWNLLEDIAKTLGRKPDVWYATNRDIYYYDQAVKQLIMSADGHMIYNPSATTVWLRADANIYSVAAGDSLLLP